MMVTKLKYGTGLTKLKSELWLNYTIVYMNIMISKMIGNLN